jgi:hypothetical protein
MLLIASTLCDGPATPQLTLCGTPVVLALPVTHVRARYALPTFGRDAEGRLLMPGDPTAYFPRCVPGQY